VGIEIGLYAMTKSHLSFGSRPRRAIAGALVVAIVGVGASVSYAQQPHEPTPVAESAANDELQSGDMSVALAGDLEQGTDAKLEEQALDAQMFDEQTPDQAVDRIAVDQTGVDQTGGEERVAAEPAVTDDDASVGEMRRPPSTVDNRRPFYVMGHNTNTMQEVRDAVNAGANAIEPDLNYDEATDTLIVSHGKISAGRSHQAKVEAARFDKYLAELVQFATEPGNGRNLALVYIDSKIEGGRLGQRTLELVHAAYDRAGLTLPTIYAVGSLPMTNFFDTMGPNLRSYEGAIVDEEDNADVVDAVLKSKRVARRSYGDGIAPWLPGPNVRTSVERGLAIKATSGSIAHVNVWTLVNDSRMRDYVRAGVDSMITDDLSGLRRILAEPEFASTRRIAVRSDDPFNVGRPAYALTVKTGTRWGAGTDAHITFTLRGTTSTVTQVMDSSYVKHMENGDTNFVSFFGTDIGTPLSVSVSIDNAGNGPTWDLAFIEVRHLGDPRTYRASFGTWISGNSGAGRLLA
jgi:hypothetical protein